MTDIEYWDGELTKKLDELDEAVKKLKSMFGGDKEEVRGCSGDDGVLWMWVGDGMGWDGPSKHTYTYTHVHPKTTRRRPSARRR